MQQTLRRSVSFAFAASSAALLLAACGGGGGGSSLPSGGGGGGAVNSTPAPGSINLPGQQSSGGGAGGFQNDGKNPSTYTVTSNPIGQTFTLNGTTYTTNTTVTPATSTSPLAIAFPSGFTVPIVQTYDGPHTVFYNRAGESTGTVAVSSLQSLRRSAAAAVAPRPSSAAVRRTFPRGNAGIDATRVTVRYHAAALRTSGRMPADIESAEGARGLDTASATSDPLRIVLVPNGIDAASFARRLQSHAEVAEVSAVHFRHVLGRAATTVSDPGFNTIDQWYTFATGTNFAWSYSAGSSARIAVIDTGYDRNNTDIAGQVVFEEKIVTPQDASGNPVPGATPSVTTGPGSAQDSNGHGTNTAGIAIAQANTAGFAGSAFGAHLIDIDIFPPATATSDTQGSDSADEALAISDAVKNGADVISLSLGASTFDTAEFNAIESAIQSGVTVVAAAGNGNDGSLPGTLDYPAAYPGVISVGASALKDQFFDPSGATKPTTNGTYAGSTEIVASYSQYGPGLSVVAPGGDAPSCLSGPANAAANCDNDVLHWIENYTTTTAAYPPDQCSSTSPATNCIALFNGTSQATPQVAATAAELIAEAGGHGHLGPAQVKYIIENTADNINDPHQGHGRLNAYKALASLVRDTAAYSGPAPLPAGTAQLKAFAYAQNNTNRPAIVDASFPAGVPVDAGGTFRIADVPTTVASYKVAVWYDANGDGVIDAGDQIGVAPATCSPNGPCAIGTITLAPVPAGYVLP